MKLERDKGDYPFVPHDRVIGGTLEFSGCYSVLIQTDREEIEKLRVDPKTKGVLGMPTMFTTFNYPKPTIMFWPTPSDEVDARIRYFPPLAEI